MRAFKNEKSIETGDETRRKRLKDGCLDQVDVLHVIDKIRSVAVRLPKLLLKVAMA